MHVKVSDFVKRIFDYCVALLAIVLLAPMLTTIALMIKREDGGTVFFHGERIGRYGIPFSIFKFRTMVVNADKMGGPSTPKDDPRITRLGRRLRKHKLDELPQLFNVLRGEMSIVGPRPEVKLYTGMYTDEEKAILRIRPGITDWASNWNSNEGAVLAGAVDPEKVYMELIRPRKLELQLKYIKEQSFRNDLKIIYETLLIILSHFKIIRYISNKINNKK